MNPNPRDFIKVTALKDNFSTGVAIVDQSQLSDFTLDSYHQIRIEALISFLCLMAYQPSWVV